jgi:hypothetical protein
VKKPVLILANIVFVFLYFSSCKEEPVVKKEKWAAVIDFLSPDSSYYPPLENFPFPALLRFALPDTLFVNQNRLPIISDSSIIYFKRHKVNGEIICCEADTLQVFSDTIRGKKYIFAIGDYIALFQSDTLLSGIKPRKKVASIPLWGIELNTPYPPDKFLNKYEKLGAHFVKLREELDEVSKQTWAANDSILVETIQFDNSNDRIITSISRDMTENDADTMIAQIKSNFPSAKYQETVEKDSKGKTMKTRRFIIDGLSIVFTQTSDTEYSFQVTDYYETLKLILFNQQHYFFRDDLKIH